MRTDAELTSQQLMVSNAGARNRLQLMRHMAIMLRSVMGILNLWNITRVMTSEYFVKTPPAAPNGNTPASPVETR